MPWESCILGAINLSNFVVNREIDYERLENIIYQSVRFLDNTIDKNEYPIKELEKQAKKYRKIGVGVMGWHEMLIRLNIRYGSEESLNLAEEMANFINTTAIEASQKLAEERGTPDKIKELGLKRRNLVVTNAAPTGSRSFIADTSGGIEPFFSFEYTREQGDGEINEFKYDFVDEVEDEGILVTAMDVSPEEHVKMQAAWQKYLGAAISKTVNMPANATKEDVSNIYKMAYETNCKGITIYRNKSRNKQVLNKKQNKTNDNNKNNNNLPRGFVKDAEEIASGIRYKLNTGCGSMWLTIVVNDNNEIIETFTESANGGCMIFTRSTSRLISLALRGGIDIDDVIDQLLSAGSCPAYQAARASGKEVSNGASCAGAIGLKLKEVKNKLDNGELDVKNNDKLIKKNNNDNYNENEMKCPECGAELEQSSGCVVCPSCGWSKCS